MKTEEYINKIIEETGLSRKEINVIMEKKRDELDVSISEEEALTIIIKELGIDLEKGESYPLRERAMGINEDTKIQIRRHLYLFYGSDIFFHTNKFLDLLNECLHISLQKIEGKNISNKFLFIDDDLDLEWPEKTIFIKFEKETSISFGFESLRNFIEITREPNVCLVLTIPNQSLKSNEVKILGLLIFYKSIDYFASQFNLWELTPQRYKRQLKCIYNSILVSIESEKVGVSFINNNIFIIEKNQLIRVENIDLKKFIHKCFEQTKFLWFIENYELEGAPNLYDAYLSAFYNLIIKISEKRHGSILIFGYNGEIKNEEFFHPGALEIKVPFITFLQDKNYDIKNDSEIHETISMLKEAIISLSNTDGALIFDNKLDLKAAGVFFKVEKSSVGAGGARKKSTEAFVRKIKKMGISISQDGPITFFDYTSANKP